MDIHGPTFASFLALGISPAGLNEAEQLLSANQDSRQHDLIKWLFQRVRGSDGERPNVVLTPADELYLEALLAQIDRSSSGRQAYSSHRIDHVPPKLDFLYFMRNDRVWSPTKLMNFFYRSHVVPTRSAAIVTCARNEAVNILEWIAHHRALGFEEFFFYVNDSDDGTVELLKALAENEICYLILNETHLVKSGVDYFPIQSKALEHAIHLLTPLRDFEWVLFSDIDEFLITEAMIADPTSERPLEDLIHRLDKESDKASGVLFNWKWFGSHSAYSREEGLNSERFRNFVGSRHVKTLARLSRCLAFPTSHVPRFVTGDHVLDGALRPASTYGHDMPVVYDYGQLNHYWNRSFEEYVAKYLRGWGFRSFKNFFAYGNNTAYGQFEQMPNGWTERVKEEIARLQSLPGVGHWHREAEVRFRQTIERYGAEHDLAALYLSGRFGVDAEVVPKAVDKESANSKILRHIVASSKSGPRTPLLTGTAHFAAPWLRYYHEQANHLPLGDLVCYSVMGAIVSGYGAVWLDNDLFAPADLYLGDFPKSSRPMNGLPVRIISHPCVVMNSHQGGSYGRGTWDWILRIGVARQVTESLKVPLRILLDRSSPDWVRNLLRTAWGITPDFIEVYDPESERIFLEHALIPASSLCVSGFHPFLNRLVDEIAASRGSRSPAPKMGRVLLTQPPSDRQPKRVCLNESELVALAVRHYGFMPVSIENVSLLGQIKLFSEADIVLTNTDLDLASCLFCRPDTRLGSLGFRTLLTSQIGALRGLQNAYFMLGTESSSRYAVEPELFSEFLDAFCSV